MASDLSYQPKVDNQPTISSKVTFCCFNSHITLSTPFVEIWFVMRGVITKSDRSGQRRRKKFSPLTSSVLLSCSWSAFCSSSTWERSSEICCWFNLGKRQGRGTKGKVRNKMSEKKTQETERKWKGFYGTLWERVTKRRETDGEDETQGY